LAIFDKLLKMRQTKTLSPDGDLVEQVCVLVARTLDLPPHLHPKGLETRLYGQGLGLDSVDGLRLVAALEEEFDITIDDTELTPATFESIGSLVSLVRRVGCGR
jgi:acyl carrier protein